MFPSFAASWQTHSACAHDGDCTVLGPFCPFGCAVPVSRVGAPEVRAAFAHVEQRCAAEMCRYRFGTERAHSPGRSTAAAQGSPPPAVLDGSGGAGSTGSPTTTTPMCSP